MENALSPQQQSELFKMVAEIYHHLGLDGEKPISMSYVRQQAEKDVLKWRSKKSIKRNERETYKK